MSHRTPMKFSLTGGLILAVGGLVIAQFALPSKHERAGAVGSLEGLSAALERTFTDDGEFVPKRAPEPGDWLAEHEEAGQTFAEYLRSRPNEPTPDRRTIYILPIGEFDEGTAPELAILRKYMAAYCHPLPVWTLPAVAVGTVQARSRVNEQMGQTQWNSQDLLSWMRGRLPRDAYAMIAVTMTDLYPEDSWNYVFGQASLVHRVGVFSFARYGPAFWGEPAGEGTGVLMLKRAAKVLTHETGHMFGMAHCRLYECNMNGANNLHETDATPMHLCPVCLRKLHHAIGFDPVARYRKLRAFYDAQGLEAEAGWVAKRIEAIEGAP